MDRPYTEKGTGNGIVTASRVRLIRNVDGYPFDQKLQPDEKEALMCRIQEAFADISGAMDTQFQTVSLTDAGADRRESLLERRLLNSAAAKEGGAVSLIHSADDHISIILGGEDHIRVQFMSTGDRLGDLYEELNRLEDYIEQKLDFAFDDKYGYLTPYPTNVGTGFRAAVTLHLPIIASTKQFARLASDMGRFGVDVTGANGEDGEDPAAMYEVSSRRTLGMSEEESISLVRQMAQKLASSEMRLETVSARDHRLEMEDEAYKAYGMLRYARKLTYREALVYMSRLRMGIRSGVINLQSPVELYGLMLETGPAGMKLLAGKMGCDENAARAQYIRSRLPGLSEGERL